MPMPPTYAPSTKMPSASNPTVATFASMNERVVSSVAPSAHGIHGWSRSRSRPTIVLISSASAGSSFLTSTPTPRSRNGVLTSPVRARRGRPPTLFLRQHATEDLADHRLGERLADLELLRDAVGREAVPRIARPVEDLLGCRVLALLQHHERLHGLARPFVGYADDRGLHDLRMTVERVLHLVGIHVVPGDDDHLLQPIDDAEVAVLVHRRDVARVQPSVPDGQRRLLGAVPVTEHHLRTLHTQLTALAGGELSVRVVEVHDPAVRVGHREPYRADLADTLQRVRVRYRRRLREPVALDENRAVRDLGELLGNGRGERGGPRDRRSHRMQVELRREWGIVQRGEEPWDARHERRLLLVDLLHYQVKVAGVGDGDELAGTEDRHVHHEHAERVEERE